ncbi:hypothetical protein KKC91_01105 [bacterium]|nr:hypothetical protein [bacterium]
MTNNIGDGHFTWLVPDGDLPPKGDGDLEGHEALIILNTGSREANIKIDVYFEDKKSKKDLPIEVDAERVLCIRLDRPLPVSGYQIPFGQYALRIRSDQKIVVQFGRLDVRQPNLAYYCTMAQPVNKRG